MCVSLLSIPIPVLTSIKKKTHRFLLPHLPSICLLRVQFSKPSFLMMCLRNFYCLFQTEGKHQNQKVVIITTKVRILVWIWIITSHQEWAMTFTYLHMKSRNRERKIHVRSFLYFRTRRHLAGILTDKVA